MATPFGIKWKSMLITSPAALLQKLKLSEICFYSRIKNDPFSVNFGRAQICCEFQSDLIIK